MWRRFHFSREQTILSTTLVAMGLTCWPLLPGLSGPPLGFFFILMFALPAAGVGLLFNRTTACFLTAVAIGMAIYLVLPRID
jgi:hypothetical protein